MNRSEMISVRVLPEEKRVLARIARQERRKPSELLRELIREEAQRHGLWPPMVVRRSEAVGTEGLLGFEM